MVKQSEHRGSYTLYLSVKPYYATVDLKGVTREEAECYARKWAEDPFGQVDLKEYVVAHNRSGKGAVGKDAKGKAIITAYTYVPNRQRLDRLLKIKEETRVPVAGQIDFAIDRYLDLYVRKPEFRNDLRKYAGREMNPKSRVRLIQRFDFAILA